MIASMVLGDKNMVKGQTEEQKRIRVVERQAGTQHEEETMYKNDLSQHITVVYVQTERKGRLAI